MSSAVPHTLFVGDLSIFCTEENLRVAFRQYGELSEVKIIRCETTNKNLSYGFVKYHHVASANAAIQQLHGALMCGRPMR
jgi:RNA recognition motif-containing protein